MKLIAMSPKFYFQGGWNVFDFIIGMQTMMTNFRISLVMLIKIIILFYSLVFLSLLEMLFEDAGMPGMQL